MDEITTAVRVGRVQSKSLRQLAQISIGREAAHLLIACSWPLHLLVSRVLVSPISDMFNRSCRSRALPSASVKLCFAFSFAPAAHRSTPVGSTPLQSMPQLS